MPKPKKLISNEQVMEILNRCGGSLNIVIISRIRGDINQAILRKALDLVQFNYPYLDYRIVGTLDNLHFTSNKTYKIPLNTLYHEQHIPLKSLILKELNTPLESNKYLLRCLLILDKQKPEIKYLITTIHHAISDGLSSVRLQAEIFNYCQIIASEQNLELKPNLSLVSTPLSLDNSFLQWIKNQICIINSVCFLGMLKTKMFIYQIESLKSEKNVAIELRSCGITQRYLAPENTRKLIKLCKLENTTVHGALCSAMLIAVANKLRKDKSRKINISCASYVDLRRRIKPEIAPENMGMFTSFLTSFHTLKSEILFWGLARDVTRQINKGLKRKDMFKPLFFLRKIVENFLANPETTFATISVTNIGRIKIPEAKGILTLEEISFVPSNVVFNRIFTVAVATFNEKMSLNFTVSQPSISQETLELLADDVIYSLTEVCNGTSD
ncbi:MAG: phthiocerol/phthiodiolone dimycocerosyl transferase family protein [cyanobacterium endosymbiont of Rhopalodia musculus]|uniref:phthiocerol/phthiodiolone dimycocerosyl transferase family protein n=1 Tax=cyanobacterium endosymbiont of Epithemia clementina EcSB TaxID=3034674 RepID=UPI0024803FC4|nr:alcohol acetyltransferase [cyanobacterium endosymbiont of Epithemia clementina EcSB]WGT68252.1 alcohol acetyltransferase [cyanobacterium endosymbiont of Epithemia clementina EcSB]